MYEATTAAAREESTDGPNADVTGPAESEPATVTSDAHRPGRPLVLMLALVGGWLVHVAWRIYLSRSVPYVTVHPDEDGYLIAARVFAGGPGGVSVGEGALFRRVLYPLLISPAYWPTTEPFTVFRNVQVINALLNALTFPLAYLFARRVLDVRRVLALVAAFAVAALPAVAYYSEFAMIDTILAPVALGWLILLHVALTGTNSRRALLAAVGSGAFAGSIYLSHARGTVLVAVHVFAVLLLAVLRRFAWRRALLAAGSAVVVAALDFPLKAILGSAISIGNAGVSESRLKVHLTTVDGLVTTVCRAIGQMWSLMVSGWGLSGVAVVLTVAWLLRRRDTDWQRWAVLVTALLASVGIAFISAAGLPDDLRINHQVYPRYLAFLVPVWTLAGIAALLNVGIRRAALRAAGGAAAVVAAGFIVLAYDGRHMPQEYFIAWDAPETSFLSNTYTHLRVAVATAAVLGLLAVFAAMLAHRRTSQVALAILILFNGVALYTITERISEPRSSAEYQDVPRLIRDIGVKPGETVGYYAGMHYIVRGQHEREIYWTRLQYFTDLRQPPPGVDLVIAPLDRNNSAASFSEGSEWHLIGEDRVHHWGVWRR
ncbi:hypothetical protein ABT297_00310 [Dactylosporangium sp. NPDC000555]|uniref:hypothetical protein n=1 Tax=Dactylosporangium sp. NPDC000555 TaxID=3154260 RepID=UPI0033336FCD